MPSEFELKSHIDTIVDDGRIFQSTEAAASSKCSHLSPRTVTLIGAQPLPDPVKEDLGTKLREIFGNVDGTKFAVRSSACGEDSEDMSAAGQMETFLGVKGLSNILDAVAKCWASQFSFVAVQYRR